MLVRMAITQQPVLGSLVQDLPLVAVSDSKFVVGANSLNDSATPLNFLPFLEAFDGHHAADTHFLTYLLQPFEPHPRINKPCLSQIRAAGLDK